MVGVVGGTTGSSDAASRWCPVPFGSSKGSALQPVRGNGPQSCMAGYRSDGYRRFNSSHFVRDPLPEW